MVKSEIWRKQQEIPCNKHTMNANGVQEKRRLHAPCSTTNQCLPLRVDDCWLAHGDERSAHLRLNGFSLCHISVVGLGRHWVQLCSYSVLSTSRRAHRHGAKSHTRGAERRVRRLQHIFQIVRHRGDSRRPGAGAMEINGCGAADFSLYHVQAERTRKARRK